MKGMECVVRGGMPMGKRSILRGKVGNASSFEGGLLRE